MFQQEMIKKQIIALRLQVYLKLPSWAPLLYTTLYHWQKLTKSVWDGELSYQNWVIVKVVTHSPIVTHSHMVTHSHIVTHCNVNGTEFHYGAANMLRNL